MRVSTVSMAVCFAVAIPSIASAVPLSTLTGGGTLSVNDVTFSGFTSNQVDGQVVDIADLDVSAGSTATTAFLFFSFGTNFELTADAFTEWEFGFSADVTGGTGRLFEEESVRIFGGTNNLNGADSAFIEFDSGSLFVEFTDSGIVATDSNAIAPATGSVTADFGVQGEAIGADIVRFSGLVYTLDLDSAFVPPPTPVPVPASLGLMAAGLGAVGVVARRRRRS
ncbi:MAG: VPLPA-CTERM sorting domain-containing protein [Pseudomonadota bacterium]